MTTRWAAKAVAAVAFAAAVATTPSSHAADDAAKSKGGKGPDAQAVLAAWDKAAALGDQHKQLQRRVGTWNVSITRWVVPGQAPIESGGVAEVKAVMDGRFIQVVVAGRLMGKPFNGLALTGYDNLKKKFVGAWMDSLGTGITQSEGTGNATGDVITSQASAVDPVTGAPINARMVSTWVKEHKVVDEYFETRAGKETKVLQISYSRTDK